MIIIAWLALPAVLNAQPASFYHLTTANGLTDNNTQSVTIDKNGFLWIGTANGLNRYDGYSVVRYSAKQQPGLCSDNITVLFCDNRNRVWAGTTNGITMIDENRRFHTIIINDSIKTNYTCNAITETSSRDVVVHTNRGSFSLDKKNNKWINLRWATDIVRKTGLRDNSLFKEEQYIQTGANELMILDYRAQKMIFDFLLPYSISACRLNDEEIMAASYKGRLFRINVSQHKLVKEYTLTHTEGGKIINSSINKIRPAPNGKILVTGSGGFFVFDPVTETFSSYAHDPLLPASIAAGGMEKVFCDAKGNIFITSADQGLNYFNILEHKAGSKTAFITSNNEIYDGYINCIRQDAKGRIWLGGRDCFVVWDKNKSRSSIYRYYYPIVNSVDRPIEVNCIYFDHKGQTWIGTKGGGMGLFNESTGSFIKFSQDSLHGAPNFANNFVYDIIPVSDDSLWLATNAGIVTFTIATHRYDTLHNSPALKTLYNRIIVKCFKASNGCIWLSRLNFGVYCYDPVTKIIKKYPVSEEKPGTYYSFAEDNAGNIYMAGTNGFACVDARGKITAYNGANGLRNDDCQALLKDKNGDIWVSNRNCLAKFDPLKKQFQFFDEKSGLTNAGFRPQACYEDKDGQLYWGTITGLNYFLPSQLLPDTSVIDPVIYQADLADTSLYLPAGPSIDLAYNKNIITFSFAAINFYNEKNILYQYRLEGLDKTWINSLGNRQVRYSSLSPGDYTFKVRDSRDGIHWTEAVNSIRVRVHPVFWQSWWFKVALVLLSSLLVYWFFRMRISKIKEREMLKREYEKKIASVEMGSLRAQMNPHFMFNSLNSINNFILKNDPDNASGYLTKFSRLMRLILDNSRSEWVLLENELKALELYIELEALRFDNAFDHRIEITGDVNPGAVLVPPMIIQPYVENAIWHGLLHRKEAGGKLDIHIWKNNGMLHIEIEDNGIGRDEAKKRKSKTAIKQKSHGMEITSQRLEIVNKLYDVHAAVAIKDVMNGNGEAKGTVVLLNMLYKTS